VERRSTVVVNLFQKGDMADPGNYRGITPSNTVGKTCCMILNDSMGTTMEKEDKIAKGKQGLGQTVAA